MLSVLVVGVHSWSGPRDWRCVAALSDVTDFLVAVACLRFSILMDGRLLLACFRGLPLMVFKTKSGVVRPVGCACACAY